MSIFRNVVLNLKTEEECDRVIGLYKEQLSSLENEGLVEQEEQNASKIN